MVVYNSGSCARKDLVYDTPDSTEREEVVVTLQGYVLRCNLPPITRLDQYVPSGCENLIKLTRIHQGYQKTLSLRNNPSWSLDSEAWSSRDPPEQYYRSILSLDRRYLKTCCSRGNLLETPSTYVLSSLIDTLKARTTESQRYCLSHGISTHMICYAPNVTGRSTPRITWCFTTSVQRKNRLGKSIF